MRKSVVTYKKQPKRHRTISVKAANVQTKESPIEPIESNINCKFPSAEIALQAVMNDYNRTYEASDSMTTRAGVLLSALLAAFMISLSNIDFGYIFNPPQNAMCNPLYYVLFLSVILHVSSGIVSFVFLILSVSTMTFQGLNCNDVNTNECLSDTKDRVARSLIRAFTESITANDDNNKIRSTRYKVGSWIGVSSILLYLCSILVQGIII